MDNALMLRQEILGRSPLPSLAPDRVFREDWERQLDQLLAKANNQHRQPMLSVLAGLYLMNESLDKSHEIAQNIETGTGSYWHGIMHRMEPDYGNAGYWFRRVGDHPVFPVLLKEIGEFLSEHPFDGVETARELKALQRWDPFRMIDAVETAVRNQDAERIKLLESIQWIEMKCLLAYTLTKE